VNRYLNTNIDFDILQSFLTGNDLSFYENGAFRASLDNNLYKLSTAERTKLKKFVRNNQENLRVLIQNIWIDPESFKILRATVKEIRAPNIQLEANYSSFEMIENQLFPKEMSFDISADNNLAVTVSFNKITINTVQVFPFKIPQSYHPVK
jgi:outer membrane lipoprotein-sorting protein